MPSTVLSTNMSNGCLWLGKTIPYTTNYNSVG